MQPQVTSDDDPYRYVATNGIQGICPRCGLPVYANERFRYEWGASYVFVVHKDCE